MTNLTVNLVYLPLPIMTAILLQSAWRLDRKQYFVKACIMFLVTLLGWQLTEMAYFAVENPFWIRYTFDLKLVFVSFMSVSFFLIILSYYRLERLFRPWFPVILCVVPAITSALSMTTPFHSLLRENYRVIAISPLVLSQWRKAPWFYIHWFYSFLLVAVAITIVIIHCWTLPRAYRNGSTLMLGAGLMFFIGAVVAEMKVIMLPLDFILIGASFGAVLLYLAISVNGWENYLHIERSAIFNYLEEAVFILNGDGRVVDTNQQAREWLKSMGEPHENNCFDDMMHKLEKLEKIVIKPSENGGGEYLYVINTKHPLIYYLNRRSIRDESGTRTGSFVSLSDVTRNRLFVERLKEMAGVDSLTGLKNRYGYHEALREIDLPENLPLSVIVGDVNGLKRINDTLGHETGDLLLRAVGEVIRRNCPSAGFAARIGGDEYVLLLPRCGRDEAEAVIHAIQYDLAQLREQDLPVAIALGSATKTDHEENLNALIAEADMTMFGSK